MGSVIGGLFGVGSGEQQASQQAANAAAQQSQNATNIDNSLLSIVNGNQGAFNSTYAPLIGAQGGVLMQLMQNPTVLQNLAKFAPQLSSFFGNTMDNGIAPDTGSFFQKEMAQGLDPAFVNNQYSRLNQAASQQLSDIVSRLGPGVNANAAARDTQNSLLSAGANLAGGLAGENQQVQEHGAQGLFDLGRSRLSGAQGLMDLGTGLDTETMNSEALRNQILQLVQAFTGQGYGQQEAGMSALGGAAGRAQNASQFDYNLSAQDAAAANQQQNDFFNSLVSLGTAFLPGGMFAGMFGGGGAGALNFAGMSSPGSLVESMYPNGIY